MMPDAQVCLISSDTNFSSEVFDQVIVIEHFNKKTSFKLQAILNSPYDKTIFQDKDTYVCEDISDIFIVLDRYDFGLAHSPFRYPSNSHAPKAFPELNSGVMAWRKNEKSEECLNQWEALMMKQRESKDDSGQDQHSLRDALFLSDIYLYVLPPEYNYRSDYPGFLGKGSKIKIIHAREHDIADVKKRLNQNLENRITLPSIQSFSSEHLIFINGNLGQKLIYGFSTLVRCLLKLKL
jgi:lipopolysaccharide biosynthesis glycosyltransferase